jgi:response regulator RpfG family c-di-GMP phosphodiesterase
MDVRMPVMDGLEATRRIRALGGTRGRVPIVALTAQAFTEQIAECHKAGMDSYLGKPFEPDTLLAAIVRAVTAGPTSDAALDPLVTQRITAVPLAVPSVSVEMPVFNREVFERTASFLAPEAVAAYLQTIATGCESLLRELHKPKALAHGNHLAEAAHALAGSAGMFGFERLADASRRFERGVRSGATEVDSLSQGLGAAIEGSLLEILDNSIVRARA